MKGIVTNSQTGLNIIPYAYLDEIRDVAAHAYYGFTRDIYQICVVSKYKTLSVWIHNDLDQAVNVTLKSAFDLGTLQIGDPIYVGPAITTEMRTLAVTDYFIEKLYIVATAVGIPTVGELTIIVYGAP